MLLQGDSTAVSRHAVGHLAETALPGESGNVVLADHRFIVRAGETDGPR